MLNCSTATMFSSNTKCFIFIVFMIMCSISESFRLQTEKSLTAVRGGSISLPCMFSVPAQAVYWYKHNFTKAPYAGASLVARDSFGFRDPLQGFERFSITKDHSLIIRTITVHDETTYSCLVVEVENERAYTDLRVIALAEPREPIIESCNVTATGRCIYDIDENSQENVTLVCGVYNVRPLPDLTWIRSDGRALENETHQTQEKNGLFNISSRTQVSKSNLDHRYTCQANGEAVNGTSSTIITINKEYDKTETHRRKTKTDEQTEDTDGRADGRYRRRDNTTRTSMTTEMTMALTGNMTRRHRHRQRRRPPLRQHIPIYKNE